MIIFAISLVVHPPLFIGGVGHMHAWRTLAKTIVSANEKRWAAYEKKEVFSHIRNGLMMECDVNATTTNGVSCAQIVCKCQI